VLFVWMAQVGTPWAGKDFKGREKAEEKEETLRRKKRLMSLPQEAPMKSFWRFGLIALFAVLAVSPTFAYRLAMKNGSVVQFDKYRVESGKVICTDAEGKEVSVAIADVDVERTTALNAKETPPLDLSGATARPPANAAASADQPQSLGDAARSLRQQGKAQATAQKHSYTDDDVAHSSGPGELSKLKEEAPAQTAASGQSGKAGSSSASGSKSSKSRAMTDQEVSEYYDLGRAETARALLSGAELPPDTPFLDRSEWESRLFEAKQDMVHAYFRAKDHLDDDDLYNEWVDKWNAFADVANEGIKRARSYLQTQPQA